jgi:hypothetical protein
MEPESLLEGKGIYPLYNARWPRLAAIFQRNCEESMQK